VGASTPSLVALAMAIHGWKSPKRGARAGRPRFFGSIRFAEAMRRTRASPPFAAHTTRRQVASGLLAKIGVGQMANLGVDAISELDGRTDDELG